MKIAVILGGRSSENPISIASATSVVRALEAAGDDVLQQGQGTTTTTTTTTLTPTP
jgi:D-alanine-D-alanine ligase-like ATP-grasp enzyme